MMPWVNGQKGTVQFYALDLPSSSVRGLFNASSAVTARYHYGTFGEPQGATGTSQPLRFAARELDATAGLYYVRTRWYDASMGRFISEDPIGLAGGINNYAYAANDPVNQGDPTGLCYRGGWVSFGAFDTGVEPCGPWTYGFYTSLVDRTYSLLGPPSVDGSLAQISDVMVACRKVDNSMGMAGHCAARVIGMNVDVAYELLSRGNGEPQWVGRTSMGQVARYPAIWTPVAMPKGMTSDEFALRVMETAERISQERNGQPYSPWGGRNSNRFVYDVITQAGGRVPEGAVLHNTVTPGICGGRFVFHGC
jgi:RHS repeat-associated protein